LISLSSIQIEPCAIPEQVAFNCSNSSSAFFNAASASLVFSAARATAFSNLRTTASNGEGGELGEGERGRSEMAGENGFSVEVTKDRIRESDESYTLINGV
jgi:hypothetical protein